MRGVAVLLILLLGLSGCLGGPLPDPSDTLADLDPLALFDEPVLVGPGGDAETSLTIGPDGTMLACAHGGFRKPSPLWVSQDGGENWTELFPEPNPIPSGDCDVAITDDGAWHMVYDTIASATIATSRDRGASWSINFATAVPFGGVDRPWILAAGNEVYMTYANVMVAEPAIHMFAKDRGAEGTWTDQTVMRTFQGVDKLNRVTGHPIAYDDNRTIRVPVFSMLFAAAELGQESERSIDLYTSRDGGATWSEQEILSATNLGITMPILARAGDGTLYLSYAMGAGQGLRDIFFLHSFDDGATWAGPTPVAEDVQFPGVEIVWVDGRSDGSATLAWLQSIEEEGWQVGAARIDAHRDEPVVWAANMTDPVVPDQIFEFIMVRHDAADRAHILYLMAGEGCEDDPASDRSRQCVYLLSEKA